MKIDESLGNEIRRLAKLGYHKAKIAKELSLSEGGVRYFCKNNQIELKSGINLISGEVEVKILDLIDHAINPSEIERLTGIDHTTILYWAKKKGVTLPNGKHDVKITVENQEQIKILAEQGLAGTAIANQLGIAKQTVFSFCDKNNIQLNKSPNFHKGLRPTTIEKLDEILRLHQEGISATETAERLQIGVHTVKDALRYLNIPFKKAYSGKFTHDQLLAMLNNQMEFTGKKESGFYEVKCKKHPNFIIFRAATDLSNGCKICNNNGTSRPQQAIAAWVESLGFQIEQNSKIDRKELDIYIPALKLGIEYCGLYWHNDTRIDAKYHHDKMKLANSHGIRLITIFEDEWLEREPQIKSFLQSVLGVSETKLFARKCNIQQINKSQCDNFMDTYHIQGASISSIVSFGLYYNEELIGVISGSKHHRAGHNDLVLDRLCFKTGVTVAGGASRLLSRLMQWGRESGFTTMISWSDQRYSEGNVYRKMGFTLDEILKPDYSYVNGYKRISKQSCKKSAIAKKWPEIYHPDKTEREMMIEVGYPRIWDCGKIRWHRIL